MTRLRYALAQLWRFGVLELRACAFAFVIVASMALTLLVPLPIARYDALLLIAIVATVIFWRTGLETGREVLATAAFHVTGLAFEIVKVHLGSWSYPDTGSATIAGVPLFAGFMYAAVGSYIARAWRLFDLTVTGYRPWSVAAVSVLIYVNFFTHHWIVDLRLVCAALLLVVCWGSWVYFTVGERRYRMPLTVSFVLIGFFLWVAENVATLLAAYRYPDQEAGWHMVHVGKFGSWALLVVVSFAMVAAWKGSAVRAASRRVARSRTSVRIPSSTGVDP